MMIRRGEAVFLGLMFLVGMGGTWQLSRIIYERNNTPELVAQRTINAGLQKELCEKVSEDILRFKEEPRTFRRTSLKALESEIREALRHLLKSKGIPPDYPIEYRGIGSQYAKCLGDIETWINIPSAGSELASDERRRIGVNKEPPSTIPNGQSGLTSEYAGRRLALVIGNAGYINRPLINSKYDADDISAFLKQSGFEVVDLRDADLKTMREGVAEFSEKLKRAEVGFVYYSGHGIEHQGRNYLIPVNSRINADDDIPRQALDASSLVERVSRAERKINIFVLDACRSSFVPSKSRSTSQGLAKMEGTRGTIIAFSTSPGMVAEDGNDKNSPYTRNLLKAMSVPGRRIEDVFKETARSVEIETAGRQIPWYNSSLLVDWSIR